MDEGQQERSDLRPTLQRAIETTAAKAHATLKKYGLDFYPMYTTGGIWRHAGEPWTHWCEGFFPGILWLLEGETGDADWRRAAEIMSRRLEPRQHDRNVHDLGFIFLSTYLPWFERTGDQALEEVLITAGRTLAQRFMTKGRYLRSFIGADSLFIDIMMNVPIIFEAARRTGDQALYDLAVEHCRTTERHLVRPDGGTAHEGIFDLGTGKFLRQSTHQGLRADSLWARGLAWSLHGFALVYQHTRDPADLAVACRNADCYLSRTDATRVPPWDFDVPQESADRIPDSSAGAIAASGLGLLATLVTDPAQRRKYRSGADEALRSLCGERYLAAANPGWEGILMHGVYHFHKKLGVDESVIWGDYFFVRAIVQTLATLRVS